MNIFLSAILIFIFDPVNSLQHSFMQPDKSEFVRPSVHLTLRAYHVSICQHMSNRRVLLELTLSIFLWWRRQTGWQAGRSRQSLGWQWAGFVPSMGWEGGFGLEWRHDRRDQVGGGWGCGVINTQGNTQGGGHERTKGGMAQLFCSRSPATSHNLTEEKYEFRCHLIV